MKHVLLSLRPRALVLAACCLLAVSCTAPTGLIGGGTSFDRNPLSGLDRLIQAGGSGSPAGISSALLSVSSNETGSFGRFLAGELRRGTGIAESLERLGRRGIEVERR